MSIPVHLTDKHGHRVDINANGELRIVAGDYDLTSFQVLDVAGTAYNFYRPRNAQQFIITGVLCFADKDVSDTTDTVIEIFEANTADSATASRTLLQFGMGKLTVLPFPNVKILVNTGVYINAKTSDDDIHLNIIGHFIPTIQFPVEL